jgi:UDP-sugar pyrophosphorylase
MPTEMTTEKSYIQFYCEYILAIQKRFAGLHKLLPLCIMTSKDTHEKTLDLLQLNNYFGMKQEQITLVQQGIGVPALQDNDARIALNNGEHGNIYFKVVTKPHGHGDIHNLLYRHDVAKKWYENGGLKWITIFQDTNGLAFHTLPLMLGESYKSNLIMNSLTVPRQAKQAIGAIVRLRNVATGKFRYVL